MCGSLAASGAISRLSLDRSPVSGHQEWPGHFGFKCFLISVRGRSGGYGFDDGQPEDEHLFMFHGFRPVTEKGMASFYRFEFPWNVDQGEVRQFAAAVGALVPFENGFGGFFLKPAIDRDAGYDAMYAICQRFWAWRRGI